jgi:hypothetical protein
MANPNITPALLLLAGGGIAVYLAVRRRASAGSGGGADGSVGGGSNRVYCDINEASCGMGVCVPLYDEGQAPQGHEDLGICFVQE